MNQHQKNSQKGGWVRAGRLSPRRRRTIATVAAGIRWATERLVQDCKFTATDFERLGITHAEGSHKLHLLRDAYRFSKRDAKKAVSS
jgi:hypothetical protein